MLIQGRVSRITSVAMLSLSLIGLTSGLGASAPLAGGPIVVTRSSSDLSASCAPEVVAQAAASFFAAASQGELDDAEALLAPDDAAGSASPFERYVFNITPGFASTDRSAVQPFLAARRAQSERISLRSAAVTPGRTSDSAFAAIVIDRDADDVGHQSLLGKVGVNCSERSIYALVIESVVRVPSAPPLCPVPRSPGDAILACSAHGPNAPTRMSALRLHLPAAVARTCAAAQVSRRMAVALGGFNTGASATFAALFAGSGVFRPDAIGTPVSTRARISATAATRYRMGEGWTAQTLSYVRRLSNAPGIRLRLRVSVTLAQEQTGARTFTVDINCATRTILRWASAGT